MDHQPLADALSAQLNGVRRVLRRRLRADLAAPALTGSQVELLRLVESAPGIGVSAAAQALHLAGNSVSTLVNQLTEAGLLRRETSPSDRRSACLSLTPAATARLTAWRAARVSLLASALDGLAPGEREALAAAVPALARLTDLLCEPYPPAATTQPAASAAPAAPGARSAVSGAPGAPAASAAAGVRPAASAASAAPAAPGARSAVSGAPGAPAASAAAGARPSAATSSGSDGPRSGAPVPSGVGDISDLSPKTGARRAERPARPAKSPPDPPQDLNPSFLGRGTARDEQSTSQGRSRR